MHTKRPWLSLSISLASTLAAAAASAAGLGSGGATAVLGQPLDFAVQVRLDPGETLTAECVQAEVTAGDRRIPPPLVRALVEMTGPDTARVRVVTQPAIDEPVIGIQLAVGCTVRMSRRYVVLADPPSTTMAAMLPALAANPAFAELAPAPSAAVQGAGAETVSRGSAAVSPNSAVRVAALSAPAAPADPQALARAQARAQERAERRAAAARQRAQAREAARLSAGPAEGPRLKLDVAEAPRRGAEAAAVEEALAAVAQAASAAQNAASAASASAARIAALESTVEQLRTESKVSKDLAVMFKDRLARAEGSGAWVLPLMALAALLAALSAWLAWRVGRVQSERQRGWQDAAAPVSPATVSEVTPSRQATAPIPFVTSELKPPAAPPAANRQRNAPAWPPPAPPVAWPPPNSTLSQDPPSELEPPMQRTEPMPAAMRADEEAPRDVSIEELIDLEQQAEFFVVLGQDEAAIDLLVEHLRSTGGGSPLPYLKLLEIHHRRDDRDAYERMRARFNQRFNAYAPEWGVDLGHGRTLDDYVGVIPRLQQVWPRPLDAMAELEALLFRKSRGELFDLPAYREVLFLYSLARDLLDRAAGDTGSVDLLLPMATNVKAQSTASTPYGGLDRNAFRDTQVPDDAPTSSLDFDVSAAERATSIFDLLDDKPQPPRRP